MARYVENPSYRYISNESFSQFDSLPLHIIFDSLQSSLKCFNKNGGDDDANEMHTEFFTPPLAGGDADGDADGDCGGGAASAGTLARAGESRRIVVATRMKRFPMISDPVIAQEDSLRQRVTMNPLVPLRSRDSSDGDLGLEMQPIEQRITVVERRSLDDDQEVLGTIIGL